MTRRLGLALIATLALTLVLGDVALADHLHAVCFVEAQPSAKLDQGYTLSVRLVSTDNKPVNSATVAFYETTDFFGKRDMLLGTVTTDGQGHAALAYLPASTGAHEIVVRFAGRDHYAATEGRTTFVAEIAAEPYVIDPAPLTAFTSKVPYVVGAVVLAVWALIAFALIGTARGVTSGARNDTMVRKGDIA